MRNLSQQEKNFITKLLRIANTSNNVFMTNIVYDELTNVDIYLNYEHLKVEYRFDKVLYDEDPSMFIDYARDFSWKIIKYFKLLKYLENNGMLFLYQESPSEENARFGRLIKDRMFISADINDADATALILECSKKTIVINQSIRDYVANDFKTEDDIKHFENINLSKENLEVARQSLIVAQRSLKKVHYTIILTLIIFVIGTIINFLIQKYAAS